MAETINVTIRLDKEIKDQAEKMFAGFGMTLSTAVNIFVRQALRQGRIPFEIYDPSHNEKNQTLPTTRPTADPEAGIVSIHELIKSD